MENVQWKMGCVWVRMEGYRDGFGVRMRDKWVGVGNVNVR